MEEDGGGKEDKVKFVSSHVLVREKRMDKAKFGGRKRLWWATLHKDRANLHSDIGCQFVKWDITLLSFILPLNKNKRILVWKSNDGTL